MEWTSDELKKILAAFNEGVITAKDLANQDKRYRVQEVEPGVFELEGKRYTEKQVDSIFKNVLVGYEKVMAVLGRPKEDIIPGFVFRLPDLPEPTKPVIVEEPALPPFLLAP